MVLPLAKRTRRMKSGNVAGQFVEQFEPATAKIRFDKRLARIDPGAPDFVRAFDLCLLIMRVRGPCGPVRRVEMCHTEPRFHVVSTGPEVIAREGMAQKALRRRRRDFDGEASVA